MNDTSPILVQPILELDFGFRRGCYLLQYSSTPCVTPLSLPHYNISTGVALCDNILYRRVFSRGIYFAFFSVNLAIAKLNSSNNKN